MTNDAGMQWMQELTEDMLTMDPAQVAQEEAAYRGCPWCQCELEHTKAEHYGAKEIFEKAIRGTDRGYPILERRK